MNDREEVYGTYVWRGSEGTGPIQSLYTDILNACAEAAEATEGARQMGVRAYVVKWKLNQPDSREVVVEYMQGKIYFLSKSPKHTRDITRVLSHSKKAV